MSTHVSTHQAKEDLRNEDLKIYLNGEIVAKVDAVVSVYDSGFMLGDGIWEAVRLHKGTLVFLNDHFIILLQFLTYHFYAIFSMIYLHIHSCNLLQILIDYFYTILSQGHSQDHF